MTGRSNVERSLLVKVDNDVDNCQKVDCQSVFTICKAVEK